MMRVEDGSRLSEQNANVDKPGRRGAAQANVIGVRRLLLP